MKTVQRLALAGLLAWGVARAEAPACGQAGQAVALGVLVSGEVAQVLVKPGQQVQKGQLLLKLDDTLFRARLRSAEARLRADEAALRQAEGELERARELYERTLLSDYELQEAEVARLQARASRSEAWSRLQAARRDLERSRLRAPFAGRVARVLAYPGQAVQNRQRVRPLLELVRENGGKAP